MEDCVITGQEDKLGNQEPGDVRHGVSRGSHGLLSWLLCLNSPTGVQRRLPGIWIWLKVSLGCRVLPVRLCKVS